MRAERLAHARPAAASVGVGLVEDCDPAAVDAEKILDQPRGFLAIGSAQVEGEFSIRRLALRLSAREREKYVDVFFLEFLEDG